MNAAFYPVSFSAPMASSESPALIPSADALPEPVRGLEPMINVPPPEVRRASASQSVERLRSLFTNEASIDLTARLLNNERSAPTSLNELQSEDIFTSVLSVDVAIKLGIPLGSASGSFARRVFIQEYAKYKDIPEGEGRVRWGVAVRWINDVKILKSEANISSLPIISASAQLGYVEASSKFQVVGLASNTITQLLPANIELTVENYVRFKDAMDKIKKHIWDSDVVVSPTILAVYSGLNISDDDQYSRAMATAWALQSIAKGVALRSSLANDPLACPTSHETIKDVYLDIARTTDLDAIPTNDARDRASTLLKGIRIKT